MTLDITIIQTAAEYFDHDWAALMDEQDDQDIINLCEAIVDYVDQSGDLYLQRLAAVKSVFPNFYY